MNFLEPLGLLGLTALIPIIALYFLKLKREQRVVPSTLLWKKVIDDMQVNAPFQRLKYSLLLLLQLLLIALMGFALAQPILRVSMSFALSHQHWRQRGVVDRLADQQGESEQDQEDHEEQREQDQRDAFGEVRNIGEAERAGDHGNDQKNDGVFQHRYAPNPVTRLGNAARAAFVPGLRS